jgi:hypothetical protein
VVDDEPAGSSETLRPEPTPVPVAGDDEQVGPVGRVDDLTLDASAAQLSGTGSAQALSGGQQ